MKPDDLQKQKTKKIHFRTNKSHEMIFKKEEHVNQVNRNYPKRF